MFLKRVDSIIQNYLMKFRFLSVLSMRIILGTAFIIHGKSKFPLPPQKLMEYFGFSPFFASFIALSEVLAGLMLIISFFLKSFIGNLLTILRSFLTAELHGGGLNRTRQQASLG